MQSIYTNLGIVLAALVATLAAMCVQYLVDKLKLKRFRSYDLVKEREIHEQINQILVELLTRSSAERAYISQFHNGTVFLGSSSDIKKSRTFERIRAGVSATADKYQDVRVSLVDDEMKFLDAPHPVTIYTSNLQDTKFRRMLELDNVVATIRMPIRQGSQIIGLLGLDFQELDFVGETQIENGNALIIERAARAIQELISQMRHH